MENHSRYLALTLRIELLAADGITYYATNWPNKIYYTNDLEYYGLNSNPTGLRADFQLYMIIAGRSGMVFPMWCLPDNAKTNDRSLPNTVWISVENKSGKTAAEFSN